ncbi:acyltransferase [Stenotrophomonas mori]|uniref:Acyltransferase n=1 Tax=Stenotrophomonas mori TaxID=2871096 RepID=A0ABT0SJR5_9GAMM|nr:acyltransferase [Stenotrophomonas mori]MCL7715578.1 acyltransferase [Stenotrophomonas mori]
MRHRIFHSTDLRARLGDYAARLGVDTSALLAAYEWLLANEAVFEEPGGDGVRVSVCSVDIEASLQDPLGRRLYRALKHEVPAQFVPRYGKNWATLKDRCLRLWEQVYNIAINKVPFHWVRLTWLRIGGARIGEGSTLWRNTEVLGINNLVIGKDSVIAWHCQIDARAGLRIGDHVAIASHVLIIAGTHDLAAPEFWSVSAPIVIEDYVWIASRALVAHGAHLGRGSVVTANTVVAKEVAPYKIVGGSGAKPMGERPHDLNYKVGGKNLLTLLH